MKSLWPLLLFTSVTVWGQGEVIDLPETSGESITNPAIMVGADLLWPGGSSGYNLTGSGVTLGQWEAYLSGNAQANTSGFSGRLTNMDTSGNSSHATHVAKFMALGSGDSGVAYSSEVLVFDLGSGTSDWAPEMEAQANLLLTTANLSYARSGGWISASSNQWYGVDNISITEDYNFGRYGEGARSLDSLAALHPYFLPVKAAGNTRGITGITSPNYLIWHYDTGSETWSQVTYSGSPPAANGSSGYDCLPNNSTGKNSLVIGACTNTGSRYSSPSDVVLSANSSTGPTDDGRIKPDLVAPAVGGYTSYSAPIVTGIIGLVQEYYHTQTGHYLAAAAVRGLLCHTASEAGSNAGPDYQMGWGLVDAEAAIDLMASDKHLYVSPILSQGDSVKIKFYADGSTNVKLTLTWNDPKGTSPALTWSASDLDNSTAILVNDLDFRLYNGSSLEASPYTLDPASPSAAASTGDNTRDNIERIDAGTLVAGWYEVRIGHKGTLSGDQKFHLWLEGGESVSFSSGSWSLSPSSWTGTEWVTVEDVSNTAELSGNHTVGTLIVKPGARLKMNTGLLTCLGPVILESSSAGDGQLKGRVKGEVVNHTYISSHNAYRHITQPVKTTVEEWVFGQMTRAQMQGSSSPSVWKWDATTPQWTAATSTDSTRGLGMALFMGSSSGYSFSNLPLTLEGRGEYRYENQNITLEKDSDNDPGNGNEGWNLLANPYTAPLDWDAIVSDNSGVTSGYYYTWEAGASAYATSDGSSHTLNAHGYIPKGQAVFIYAPSTSSGTLALDTSHVQFKSGNVFKSTSDALRIKWESSDRWDDCLVLFSPQSQSGIDFSEDAIKKEYTYGISTWGRNANNIEALSIDCRPNSNDLPIPLWIKSEDAGFWSFTPSSVSGIRYFLESPQSKMEVFPNTQYPIHPQTSDRNWVLHIVQPHIGMAENPSEENPIGRVPSVSWSNGVLITYGVTGPFYIISSGGKMVHRGVLRDEKYPLPTLSAGVYQLITQSGKAFSLVVPNL